MDDGELKILGVRWSYSNDCLIFDLSDLASHASKLDPTKRSIVGVASRVYDPVGFVSPVTIRFKVLFQELCEAKLDWDEPLTPDLLSKWQTLVSSLQEVQPLTIPRCYFEKLTLPVLSCRLLGFCDASKSAYAAVIYLLMESECGCFTRFVACKTRVSPVKGQTIPRLELLSALLLSKLMTSVTQALELEISLEEPNYFTDSMVSLYWIKGQEKEWKPFVQNRVNQIRSLSQTGRWAHCAGKENPADIPSRGIDPSQLSTNSLWLYGPKWLHGEIPDAEDIIEMPEQCKSEQRKTKKSNTSHTMLNVDSRVNLSSLINCEDFSSKERLFRVTAYVLKFVKLIKQRSGCTNNSKYLTPAELQLAENYWLKEAQALLESRPMFKTWQQQFGLFQDDSGIWRCGGRLSNADLPFATKHPVFLDSHHHLTTLIVTDAHTRIQHNGVCETLNELRAKYWIIRGRSFVRRVLHRCVTCRRFEGGAHYPPPPPPLPAFRVQEAPAFTYTGVDFAGPLYVKGPNNSTETKVWICLFTCCVVRAIHLEVVPDLTAQSFIRCFKRFTARRGFPTQMISDNGKTFVAASKLLLNIVNHPEVEHCLTQTRIQWSFNLERAPWWGGIFERMVKSVKRCLRKTIGRGRLTLDELQTATTEVEMIVNSRPLSYLSTDSVQEPITPSHLLTGHRVMSLPDGPYNNELGDDINVKVADITKRVIHLNKVLEHFWRRWKKEYLLELRESHRHAKHPPKESSCGTITVGDIVLVHEENKPRGFWKLAKVESLIKGADGLIRGATVRLHSTDKRFSLLRRPLQLLYPLEVHQCSDAVADQSSDSDNGTQPASEANNDDSIDGDQPNETRTQVPRRQSRHVAASNAREMIRIQSEDS